MYLISNTLKHKPTLNVSKAKTKNWSNFLKSKTCAVYSFWNDKSSLKFSLREASYRLTYICKPSNRLYKQQEMKKRIKEGRIS